MTHRQLEQKRPTLMTLGFIAALASTLCAFEWTSVHGGTFQFADLGIDHEEFEIDLQPITIAPDEPVANVSIPKAPQKKSRSRRIVTLPDMTPIKPRGGETTSLAPLIKTDSRPRTINRSIAKSSSGPRTVRGLQPHELPYMRKCGHIENDVERFQCTQNELKRHVASNFDMPDEREVKDLPGKVQVYFTIDAQGVIKDIKAKEEQNQFIDQELERVLTSMPEMVPAAVSGERIAIRFELPIILERH